MFQKFSLVALAIFALSALPVDLRAQATASAALEGTVTDNSGAVVPNADVSLASRATGFSRMTKTGASGLYRFELLPAGRYEVLVASPGFGSTKFENVELAVGQTSTVNASITPKAQSEIVVVESAAAPLVDVQKTDVSLPISTQQVEELPLNGRDFVNLAYLAPGARPVDSYDPTKNRVGVFSVNGSSGRNVNVTVNGIDNKDNTVGGPVMQLPLEAVQEFLISTQRFSAANGRSEGAAVNVITKSGTNQLHGSLYFQDRSDVFNANDYFSEKAGQDKSPYSRQQFGGSIGAPVRKDKDFLFFALERSREQTNIVVDPVSLAELNLVTSLGAQPAANIPTPYFDWRYNGRLDHRFNEKNNLAISYSNQNNRGLNDQSGSQTDLSGGNFTTNQLILASAALSSVITPHIVNIATIGYQYWNNLIDSEKKVNNLTFSDGTTFGTNINVPQQSFQKKWQFKDDLSITRGKHSIKVGFDFLNEPALGGFFENNAAPTFTFFDVPSVILANKALYPQGFATPGAVQSITETNGNPYFFLQSKMFGIYAQDDWRITPRFTISLGLRYDRDFNLNGGETQAKNRTYLELKAINSSFAGKLPGDDTKDFSPRVGFAYDLTGSGKHVLRGGYGLYFGQTFQNIPLFMIQQANPTLFTTQAYNSNGPTDPNSSVLPSGQPLAQYRYGVDPVPPLPVASTTNHTGDAVNILDPLYRNPYTQQWNIGYAWSLSTNSVIEAEYVHVLSLHENKNVVINPKINGVRFTSAPLGAAGLPVVGRITAAESIGRSRYDGMNISYRKRLSNHFTLNASYVLSQAQAYNGAAASYSSRPSILTSILSPTDFGPTPSDERHRVVISGFFELPFGIKIAPIMQLASGRPYNAVQGISDVLGFGGGQGASHAVLLKSDINNYQATKAYTTPQLQDCLTAGNCVFSTYDSRRGEAFFQLDTRFSKEFKFREKARLDLFFQAFDLTNRANFGNSYQGSIRSAAFGLPTGFITPSGVIVPRSFSGEFGAAFRF